MFDHETSGILTSDTSCPKMLAEEVNLDHINKRYDKTINYISIDKKIQLWLTLL